MRAGRWTRRRSRPPQRRGGEAITNTYPDGAPDEVKLIEEIRCVRCCLERILRVMDEGLFVDYQMEKFSGRGGPEEEEV